MKRLVILLLAIVAHLSATAQVITISSDFFKKPVSELKIKLVDSITSHKQVIILNQTTNFRHTTTANYVEDSYKKIIGRRILVGITFNFGKMNTAKNSAAN
ncbi:MAG: hypothetical protein J6U47_06525, partial [Bacteroidales bacterium]|nr:hypothetical protein [Bacteroidales bacterium]